MAAIALRQAGSASARPFGRAYGPRSDAAASPLIALVHGHSANDDLAGTDGEGSGPAAERADVASRYDHAVVALDLGPVRARRDAGRLGRRSLDHHVLRA